MTDGALTAREAGEILFELRIIRERLDVIDDRLRAGDERFQALDREKAATAVERKIATKIGGWLLGAAAMIGGAAITALAAHAPTIAAWLVPPKH